MPGLNVAGLDIPKHGEPAYPLESYGHGWVEKIIMKKLRSGELPEPDEHLYPEIHTSNGKRLIFIVNVGDTWSEFQFT